MSPSRLPDTLSRDHRFARFEFVLLNTASGRLPRASALVRAAMSRELSSERIALGITPREAVIISLRNALAFASNVLDAAMRHDESLDERLVHVVDRIVEDADALLRANGDRLMRIMVAEQKDPHESA